MILSSRAWLFGVCTFAVVCLANVAHAGMVDEENTANPNSEAKADATQQAANQAADCEKAVAEVNEALEKGQEERAKRLKERKDAICSQEFSAAKAEEKKVVEEVKADTAADAAAEAAYNAKFANAMGADARNQDAYNPPKNMMLNGQEVSWAKYESFRQIGASYGYTDDQIAGIAGRLQVESNAFSPTKDGSTALGDGGTSSGKAQWHNERGTALVNYINEMRSGRADANDTGYTAASLANNGKTAGGLKYSSYDQSNFIFKEMSSQMSASNYAALKNSTSAEEAAYIFTKYYERPASDASQKWGLAGGNATANFAAGLASTNGNAVVADMGQWGSRQLATYNSSAGTGSGSSSTNNSINSLVSQLLGTNGSALTSLLGGNGSNSIGSALSSLLSGGSSSSSSDDDDDDDSSSSTDARTLVSTVTTVNTDGSIETVQKYSDGLTLTSKTAPTTSATMATAAATLSSMCSGSYPNSPDAFMLMISQCTTTYKL